MAIIRQPEIFSQRKYDLVIVGGGIYGAMLALEATFRGLRPLLLERNDFGAATSFNSLRIVHGGLRYLQTFDLKRHLESVQERRWFLTNFPDLVHPLPCLMPLYGRGLRRKSVFRTAMLINDLLSMYRNDGVPAENSLPNGSIVSSAEAIAAFPGIARDSLQGAAVWYDAAMPDSQRIVIEVLEWAAHYGADAANYVNVSSILTDGNTVSGVVATDKETGAELSFRAPIVINSSGPWSANVADEAGSKAHTLFWPSLAWNILTNRSAPSEYALAVTPPRSDAPTYFLHPWKGRLLIGTGHAPWEGAPDNPAPSSEQVQETIDDINSSVPELALASKNVDRIFSGLLPATAPLSARLATRPKIIDHSKSGGPHGLISICGVKFTTARRVAAHTLDKVYGKMQIPIKTKFRRAEAASVWQSANVDISDEDALDNFIDGIGQLIADESAMKLSDVVFRRTDLWAQRELALKIAPRIGELFDWPEDKKGVELAKLADELGNPGSGS